MTWSDRRVLVIGHNGFIGSWFAAVLAKLGADVVGFAAHLDPEAARRETWLAELGVRSILGDVRDQDSVVLAMQSASFDVVVHLAAQALVGRGFEHPKETIDVNVGGSANVLEAARLSQPGALIYVTSDKCYRSDGTATSRREDDPLGGRCPYSSSKAMAEQLFELYTSCFRSQGGIPPAASVRLGNVLGGGDTSDRLVPNCVRALVAGSPIPLRSGGNGTRPWQHVLDVSSGFLLLADALLDGSVTGGDVFNFGPQEVGVTAREVVATVAEEWGAPAILATVAQPYPEDLALHLDSTKAATVLGWHHRYDVAATCRLVAEWHADVLAGATEGEAISRQVGAHLELMSLGAL